MIQFRTLGTVDLRDDQGRAFHAALRRPKLLALLGYLCVARPLGFHRRDSLVALLWPELDNAHARSSLRQAVHDLREALGRAVLVSRGDEEIAVGDDVLCCDVRDFAAALDAGDAERALALYGGEFLTGLHVPEVPEFERWLDDEREHLRRLACHAAQALTDREAAARNLVGAARWADRLLVLAPSDEGAARRLIDLLDRAGDRAGAVHAYEDFERRLARDLELEPSEETRALAQRIRRRGASIDAPEPVPADGAKRRLAHQHAMPTAPYSALDGHTSRTVRRRLTPTLVLGAAGLVTAGWLFFRSPDRGRSSDTEKAPESILVLPFTNLGAPEDTYFADGMTDELAARLTGVHRFRVLRGGTAERYRSTRKPARDLGADTGVDYVLEGSVGWQTSTSGTPRVRVTPRLLSAKDGTQLWANVYDQPLDQIFRVQSDIATRVVAELDVALSRSERQALAEVPTRNVSAYQFYLRGIYYAREGVSRATGQAAVRMFDRAIELDSGFALAYAQRSRMRSRNYWNYIDRSAERLRQSEVDARRALRLRPDLSDGHLSLALYYGLARNDYDTSMREFALAEPSHQKDWQFYMARATVRLSQNRVAESIPDYEKARQLDPASAMIAQNASRPYDMLRDYPRAEERIRLAMALQPDWDVPMGHLIWMYLRWDGNTKRARSLLPDAERVGLGGRPPLVYARVMTEIFDRQYDRALAILAADAPEIIQEDQDRVVPRAQMYALIYGLTGRQALARAYYDTCRRIALAKLRGQPDDPRLHAALGIAYAGIGRRQDAVREGLEAVSLGREPITRLDGQEWELAHIYAMLGEQDLAVDRLEHLLSLPSLMTVGWLGLDPVWDPLRGNARFRRLLRREGSR